MSQIDLEEGLDRLGQSVVVAVALAAEGHRNAGLAQPLVMPRGMYATHNPIDEPGRVNPVGRRGEPGPARLAGPSAR
jgi:hypothetical protein